MNIFVTIHDFFFLDYSKIHNQKISALDIVESWESENWLVSYVTCVDNGTSFFNLMINIFIFRCGSPYLRLVLSFCQLIDLI